MNRPFKMSLLSVVTILLLVGCTQPASGDEQVAVRPDGLKQGPAQVAALLGAVEIQSSTNGRFAARAGMWLGPDDLISVPHGGLAVVWLQRNNYLVRIDEEVEMRIDDIFLLNAPRVERSPEDQIAALLSHEERNAAERIVGWRVGMRGAQTVGHRPDAPVEAARVMDRDESTPGAKSVSPPLPPSVSSSETRKDLAGQQAFGRSAGEAAPVRSKAEAKIKKSRKRTARVRSALSDQEEVLSESRKTSQIAKIEASSGGTMAEPGRRAAPLLKLKQRSGPDWMRVVDGELVTQQEDAPAVLQLIAGSGVVKKALLELLGSIGHKQIGQIQVRLLIRDGRVERLWIQGGLPVPPALLELAVGKAVAGQADGWLVMELFLR